MFELKNKKNLLLIIPAIFLLLMILSDTGVPLDNTWTGRIPLREVFIWLAIVSGMICAFSLRWHEERSLLNRLKLIALEVFGLALVFSFLRIILSKSYTVVLQPVYARGIGPLGLLVLVFAVISIITALKGLIFIQQSKRTAFNFRLLVVLLCIQIGWGVIIERNVFYESSWTGNPFGDTVLQNIFFGLLLFMAAVNGFRCKWIHYLNKNRKAGVFLLGMIIFGLALGQVISFPAFVREYSRVAGSFYHAFLYIFAVYSGMALFGLMLQLPSAGLLDRRLKEIRSFQALSATIGSVLEKDELISKTVELALGVVDADSSWIELKEKDGFMLAGVHPVSNYEIESLGDHIRQGLREAVIKAEGTLILNDLDKFKKTRKMKKWSVRAGSLLAARIQLQDKVLGILYASKISKFGFVEESKGLFQAFADQVAVALENTNLIQVTIEQEIYREELRVAHEAQMRLLPHDMPEISGVEIDAFCRTANEIGGDFYDFISVGDNRLDIVIGDVSGKGAEAAFYMAELKGVIQALAFHCDSPKQIMLEVNTYLEKNFESNMFATMAYGIFTPSTNEIRMARAGHPPLGVLKQKGITWNETRGLGLGLTSNKQLSKSLSEKTIQLKPDEALFLYTDGLVEARNRQNQEFGEPALTELLTEKKSLPAGDLLAQVQDHIENFTKGVPRHDDMTAVILKIKKADVQPVQGSKD